MQIRSAESRVATFLSSSENLENTEKEQFTNQEMQREDEP